MKYFSSDWHLGDIQSIDFGSRPYNSVKEMNETIIKNMTDPIKAGDVLYFLGDFSCSLKEINNFFKKFNKDAQFVFIKGNHDEDFIENSRITEKLMMKEIMIDETLTTLCHFPLSVWHDSYFNSWDLHGHVHRNQSNKMFKGEGKILNVNCEYHNFKPWSEIEIAEYMNNQPNNFDYNKDWN